VSQIYATLRQNQSVEGNLVDQERIERAISGFVTSQVYSQISSFQRVSIFVGLQKGIVGVVEEIEKLIEIERINPKFTKEMGEYIQERILKIQASDRALAMKEKESIQKQNDDSSLAKLLGLID